MAKLILISTILTSSFVSFEVRSSFLDFEELNNVNYGIDIIDKPVVIGQESPGSILLRSKYGQQYQCSYPDRQEEDERQRHEQQQAIDTGIPELLRPMADQGCLIHPKDWWTYEFCYGKHVKQYHLEDGKIAGNIIFLGHYESEFDWSNITEKDKQRRYHSHKYTNGSICDLTNRARNVEVRFECEEGQADYVYEISEAETCVYTMLVHTPRLCKHPYLRQQAPAKPVPITCNPLITADQYAEYLDAVTVDMRRKEEEREKMQYTLLSTKAGHSNRYFVKKQKESTSEDLSVRTDAMSEITDPKESVSVNDSPSSRDGVKRQSHESESANSIDSKNEALTGLESSENEKYENLNSESKSTERGIRVAGALNKRDSLNMRESLRNGQSLRGENVNAASRSENDNLEKDVPVSEPSEESSFEKEEQPTLGQALKKLVTKATEEESEELPSLGQSVKKLIKEATEPASENGDYPEVKVKVLTDASELEQYIEDMINSRKPRKQDETEEDSTKKDSEESQAEGQTRSEDQEPSEGQPEGEAQADAKESVTQEGEDTAESVKPAGQGSTQETSGGIDGAETPSDNTETVLDDDEKIMEEFDRELNEIVNTAAKKEHLARYKENVDSSMQSQFSNIVDEAEQELAKGGFDETVDRKKAYAELARTLSELLKRLPKKETGKKLKTDEQKSPDGHEVAEVVSEQSGSEGPGNKKDVTATDVDSTGGAEDTKDSSPDHGSLADDSDATDEARSLTNLHSTDSRVRVRVTRIKHSASDTSSSGPDVADPRKRATVEIPDEQREQLESTVKTELEKAGLETKGQKIEVKIITAGYFDTNKEGVQVLHVLSDEDSSAFNNMVVSILGGSNLAAKEYARQRQMEDAYSRVWGGPSKKRQQLPTRRLSLLDQLHLQQEKITREVQEQEEVEEKGGVSEESLTQSPPKEVMSQQQETQQQSVPSSGLLKEATLQEELQEQSFAKEKQDEVQLLESPQATEHKPLRGQEETQTSQQQQQDQQPPEKEGQEEQLNVQQQPTPPS